MESIFQIKEFHSDENSLNGIGMDLKSQAVWKCTGQFSQSRHSLQVKCFSENGYKSNLPLTNELFGFTLGFDTIRFSLNRYKWSANVLDVDGSVSIENLSAFHRKISEDTIKISSASFDFNFHAGKSFLEIDSSSSATLATIRFQPYLKYTSGKEK